MKIFLSESFFDSKKSIDEDFDLIESLIGEDYPSSFSMDEFKDLTSFNKRIKLGLCNSKKQSEFSNCSISFRTGMSSL